MSLSVPAAYTYIVDRESVVLKISLTAFAVADHRRSYEDLSSFPDICPDRYFS